MGQHHLYSAYLHSYCRLNMAQFSTQYERLSNEELESGPDTNSFSSGKLDEFTDTKIRHGFLRKVFGLLSVCLTISFGLCLAGNLIEPFKQWLMMNIWFGYLGCILMLVFSLLIICVERLAETFPINFMMLFGYALSVGMVFAGLGAAYSLKVLSLAIGTTAAISVSCMLFACQTTYDFTKWYPYAMVACVSLTIMGIVGWFLKCEKFEMIYSTAGVLLFSFMLVMDTQMIAAGKRTRKFNVDQYTLATMILFGDIVQIFLYLLRLFEKADD